MNGKVVVDAHSAGATSMLHDWFAQKSLHNIFSRWCSIAIF
jgi:hypothetical protein